MVSDDPASTRGGGMGGGVVPGLFDPPESHRPTLLGTGGAAVAGHPLTTQVALDVLGAGGNAVDAGVAAALASVVVQPDMANLGGIAPILVRRAGERRVHSVGGVGVWGQGASIEGFLERHGDRMPLGAPVAIVPGAPGAYLTALARFGTWPLDAVAAPAIALARGGFPVDQRLAHTLSIMVGNVRWESTRAVYQPDGRSLTIGDILVQDDLGRLLETLVDAAAGYDRRAGIAQARACFYEGDIAARIAATVTEGGGWLDAQDLARYETEVAEAPQVPVGRWELATTSTWTQGPIVLQALRILEHLDLGDDPTADLWLHPVIESLKLAFSERERCYGDPAVIDVDVDALLSDEHIDCLRGRIGAQALANLPTMSGVRSTTYLSVVDAHGNAFSCAPSDTIDGAPLIEGLGILCSPRGVQSRLIPGHPNALAAGKRPCITPAPAIAVAPSTDAGSDDAVWSFGCPGGDVIVQAMVQHVLLAERTERSLQQTVEAPRIAAFNHPGGFHPHPEADGVVFVEDRIPPATREALRARGHDVRAWPAYEFDAGSVQSVRDLRPPTPDRRVLAAAADPRRSAYAGAR